MTEQREVCEYCNSTFTNKIVLKTHLNTNKKCLALRGMSLKTEFICDGCKNMYISMSHLSVHQDACKNYLKLIIKKEKELEYNQKLKENELEYDKKIEQKELEYNQKLKENELEYDKKIEQKELEYYQKLEQKEKCRLDYYKENILLNLKNERMLEEQKDMKNKILKFENILINLALNNRTNYDIENKHNDDIENNNKENIQENNDENIKENNYKKIILENIDNIYNEIKEYKFGNSDFVVPIRADGMINATALCKAANKKLNHYIENKNTKEYLEALKINTGIPVLELLNVNIGGKHNGTWVHRKVGYHLAQWLSPEFAVQVSNILDELFITGKVELNTKVSKDDIELELLYKEKINTLTEEYQNLLTKHNSSLKNHRYIKFKKSDPCFYIIDSGIDCDCIERKNQYKFGIAGTDQMNTIDDRLKSHRTLWPLLKVRFLLFIKDVTMIEKSIKMIYEKEINPNGHEIIEGVLLETIIDQIKKLIDILCIKDYYIMNFEKLKEYNDYVDTIVKPNK